MKPTRHVVWILTFLTSFLLCSGGGADDRPTKDAQAAARNALAKLASVWKQPPNSNGASLSEDNDPAWIVRMESLVALAKAGPKVVPVLVETLADKNAPVASRILAAQALSLFPEPSARPALEAALKEPQGQIRLYTIQALRALGPLEPAEKYRQRVDSDGYWRVQVEAAFALHRADKPDPGG